jgi:hypothetical protein
MGLQVGGLGRTLPMGSCSGDIVCATGSPAMEGLTDDVVHRLGTRCSRNAHRRTPTLNMEESKITFGPGRSMEEENGGPQERTTRRRQLSPSTWLMLLLFLFLMRANHANESQSDEMGMWTRVILHCKAYSLIRTICAQLTV